MIQKPSEVTLPLYPVLWCSFPSLLQRSCPHLAGTLASTRGRKCTFFSGYFFLFQETNCKSCHAYYKRCKKDRPMKNIMVASFFFSDSSFISNTDNIGFQWLDAKKAYMKIFPKKYPEPFMYIPGRIVDATTNWLEQRLPWKWLRRE